MGQPVPSQKRIGNTQQNIPYFQQFWQLKLPTKTQLQPSGSKELPFHLLAMEMLPQGRIPLSQKVLCLEEHYNVILYTTHLLEPIVVVFGWCFDTMEQ